MKPDKEEIDETDDKVQWAVPKEWNEFRETGLFLLLNSFLHIFGWSIVLEADGDGNITNAYPARVKFRGFSEESTTKAYQRVSKFMSENADDLYKESKM